MISEGTINQLNWAESHSLQIGIRKDYRSSISTGEFPVFIKYTGNEEYWNSKEQIVINQSEFNSLGLQFMHFMNPELNWETNPYKVMKVWVDIGGERKTPMIGVQQVYKDTIKCKLIGTPEEIEAVKLYKRYEEDISWEDELARIREYSGNDLHRGKEIVKKMVNSGEEVRITTMDDYDFEYVIHSDWKSYKRQLNATKRIRYLEEQIVKIEKRTSDMTEVEKQIYLILADEYGLGKYDIDERHLLAEDSSKIAKKFDTHPAEVWKAFWVYIEPYVEGEIRWLEEQLY